jgi:hypothetical protein
MKSTKTVYRHDRDLHPILSSTDGDDNWQSRIYRRAEARQREADREAGRESLRNKIGLPRPPQSLREKIMAKVRAPERKQGLDVVAELRKRREERERKARVRHP